MTFDEARKRFPPGSRHKTKLGYTLTVVTLRVSDMGEIIVQFTDGSRNPKSLLLSLWVGQLERV